MNPINRRAWVYFVRLTKPFFTSEERWRVWGACGLLLAFLLSMSGLNVVNSYVGRDFMTAVAEREQDRVIQFAFMYVAVFAASTVVAVLYQYTQDRFGLWWRQWLTCYLAGRYLANHAYYRIHWRNDIDNPDQRITDDVKTFTATALSFVLMILNATITVLAFAGVLWSITPVLLLVAVGYAIFGSLMTILLGGRLVGLDNLQLKKEADLRYQLIHTREYAEPIALLRGEKEEKGRIEQRLQRVVDNFRAVVTVIRNLGFFTNGYRYLVPLIPVLIVAPRYLRGEVEFGVVTQGAMAFAQILDAFSLIVVQFQNISAFAAVVGRLGTLWDALEGAARPNRGAIHIVEDDTRVAYEELTLWTPREGRLLIKELSLAVRQGNRLLITGVHGGGKSALFRATAGLWEDGAGHIFRPHREQVMFLPQQPYMIGSSLREELLYGATEEKVSDERILAMLRAVKLEGVVARVGGLDRPPVEADWPTVLSAGEQQELAIARLLLMNPRFAFLDRAISGLAPDRARQLYQLLAQTSITYLSVGEHVNLEEFHDNVLKLHEDGGWEIQPLRKKAPAAW